MDKRGAALHRSGEQVRAVSCTHCPKLLDMSRRPKGEPCEECGLYTIKIEPPKVPGAA